MSVQSPYGTSSWAFWPVGDRYSLTPKFGEKYADTDSTVRPQDEKNRLSLVGDYGASEVFFVMELRDMTDPKNPVVPSEEPAVFAKLEKLEGWIDSRTLTPEFIMETPEATEEDPEPVPTWNGDLKFTLSEGDRAWLGHSVPSKIVVDVEFPSDAPQRIRVGYGTIVLRP
jgi:hypothetical protein